MNDVEEQIQLTHQLAIEVAKERCAYPYLVARYIERLDNYARIISYNIEAAAQSASKLSETQNERIYEPMLHALLSFESFGKLYDRPTSLHEVAYFLILEEENASSLINVLQSAISYAKHPLSDLPSEAQACIESFNNEITQYIDTVTTDEVIDEILGLIHSFTQCIFGLIETSMSRGRQYDFFKVGIHLERADCISRLVECKRFTPIPELRGQPIIYKQWKALIKSASAHGSIKLRPNPESEHTSCHVLDGLLFDRKFPRSIRFCIAEADKRMRSIAGIDQNSFTDGTTKALGRLRAEMDFTGIEEVMSYGISEYLSNFQIRIKTLHDTIEENYFLRK